MTSPSAHFITLVSITSELIYPFHIERCKQHQAVRDALIAAGFGSELTDRLRITCRPVEPAPWAFSTVDVDLISLPSIILRRLLQNKLFHVGHPDIEEELALRDHFLQTAAKLPG